MRITIFVLIFFLIGLMNNDAQAQVVIIQSDDIQQLLNKEKQINKSTKTISGWSIQILSSDDRNKVTELKGVFLNTYPGIPVDWDYEAPYYKLRAGAYRTKAEANEFLSKVIGQFPDAYIVRNDKIPLIDLL
jgi:transcription antitermination factor NusA-like protein